MFEEPFRWMEAISTRHSYVQEKLQKGQPVIAVPYDEGALLLGFSPQPGKIFEVYDRIALGGLGHPADVEKIRMTLLEMAHLEGFNRSDQDVTIARLLQFGIAPSLKQNFEEVMRAPYLIQLLLVEIDFDDQLHFYRLNYDGYWETFQNGAVVAGDVKMRDAITREIDQQSFATYSLDKALEEVCKIWEQARNFSISEDAEEENETEDIPSTLKEAFEKWYMEGAVLSKTVQRKSLYRPLSSGEIEKLKSTLVKS